MTKMLSVALLKPILGTFREAMIGAQPEADAVRLAAQVGTFSGSALVTSAQARAIAKVLTGAADAADARLSKP